MTDKQSGKKSSNLGELTKTGGPGRPVGSRNKIPANLRADLITVYERLGGIEGMVGWAKAKESHLSLFYRLLASTLPRELAVTAKVGRWDGYDKLSDEELLDIINGQATKAIDIESDDITCDSNHSLVQNL